MTRGRRPLGAFVAGAALALGGGCDRGPEEADTATTENPLVIDAPRLVVASGPDTTVVMGPTVFAFFGVAPVDDEPTQAVTDAARGFRSILTAAEPGLRALRIRIVQVERPPEPLGLPPAQDEAAGRRLAEGGVGFLLVDPLGRIRRIDRLLSGTALVCAAAATFQMAPPPEVGGACG